jgi:hypothetical protein
MRYRRQDHCPQPRLEMAGIGFAGTGVPSTMTIARGQAGFDDDAASALFARNTTNIWDAARQGEALSRWAAVECAIAVVTRR